MPATDVFSLDVLRDYLLIGAALFALGMLGPLCLPRAHGERTVRARRFSYSIPFARLTSKFSSGFRSSRPSMIL